MCKWNELSRKCVHFSEFVSKKRSHSAVLIKKSTWLYAVWLSRSGCDFVPLSVCRPSTCVCVRCTQHVCVTNILRIFSCRRWYPITFPKSNSKTWTITGIGSGSRSRSSNSNLNSSTGNRNCIPNVVDEMITAELEMKGPTEVHSLLQRHDS